MHVTRCRVARHVLSAEVACRVLALQLHVYGGQLLLVHLKPAQIKAMLRLQMLFDVT